MPRTWRAGDLEALPVEWPHERSGPSVGPAAATGIDTGIDTGLVRSRSEAVPWRYDRAAARLTAAIHWVGDGLDRAARPARRLRDRYRATIAVHHGLSPRAHSCVQHRVGRPAPEVLQALLEARPPAAASGPRLDWDSRRLEHVGVEHEHRVPGRLVIPWSYPRLPVWIGVREWSDRVCVLDLALRSRRRLRYPARYFAAGHRVLDELLDQLDRLDRGPAPA